MNLPIFTPQECDWMVSLFDTDNSVDGSLSTEKIFSNGETVEVRYKKGNHHNKITNLTDPNLNNFLIEKLSSIGVKNIGIVRVIRYVKGDYMGPHTDFSRYGEDASVKTIVVQLSDDKDYVGGDLIVDNKVQSRERGCCVMMSSTQVHEVKPIEDGVRFSLAIFLWKDDIEITKSIL
jgi:hypothetical protein